MNDRFHMPARPETPGPFARPTRARAVGRVEAVAMPVALIAAFLAMTCMVLARAFTN